MKRSSFLFLFFILSCKTQTEKFAELTSVKKLNNIIQQPHILLSAMEWGSGIVLHDGTTLENVQAGGLGTVVRDWIEEYPRYIDKLPYKNAAVSFAFMAFNGKTYGDKVFELKVPMGVHTEIIEVFKTSTKNQANLFFLKNKNFSRHTIKNPYKYESDQPIPKHLEKFKDLNQFYDYLLFGKAIAALYYKIGANILHLNDYQTISASLYIDKSDVVQVSIHNGGSLYAGEFQINPEYLKIMESLLGTSQKNLYEILLKSNKQLSFLRATWLIGQNNLFGGIAVSEGYAKELALSKNEIVSLVKKQKKTEPKDVNNLFMFNGNTRFPFFIGINNGLSQNNHAWTSPLLKKMNGFDAQENIKKEIAAQWTDDLNFGSNIVDIQENKKKIKKLLQQQLGLEVAEDRPIIYTIGRIAKQKSIHILIQAIETLVRPPYNAQIIIIGPGKLDNVNNVAEKMMIKYPKSVYFRSGYISGREKILVQSGSDFIAINSLYEPCGLTDIESSFMGSIVIAKKTGGIGKVKNGFYYEWNDNTDIEGEVSAFIKSVDQAMEIYHDKKRLNAMRLAAMNEKFDWQEAIKKYFMVYKTSAVYKILDYLSSSKDEKFIHDSLIELLKIIDHEQASFISQNLEQMANFYKRDLSEVEKMFQTLVRTNLG